MYHLHTLIYMSYAYPQICLTRKGNTTIIEAPFLGSGCGRVVQGAGRKAKRIVLQCINGVGSNHVEGRTKNLTALKSNSNTVWFNFQTYIYNQIFELTEQLLFDSYIVESDDEDDDFVLNQHSDLVLIVLVRRYKQTRLPK